MSKPSTQYKVAKFDPNSISWSTPGRYEEIVKSINNLKIGEGISVQGISDHKGTAQYLITQSYKQVKGNYRLRSKIIGSIVYFRKDIR